MPMYYKTGEPSLRRISNTKRKGKLAPELSLEGDILSKNGFKEGQTAVIHSNLLKYLARVAFGLGIVWMIKDGSLGFFFDLFFSFMISFGAFFGWD